MSLLTLEQISLAFGDRDILRNINLTLDTGSRIALAGANGSGKSTLMKIMAGILQQDSGKVHTKENIRISYLPQEGITHSKTTLYREAEEGFAYLQHIIKEKEDIEKELSECGEGNEKIPELLRKQHGLQEYITDSGYYSRKQIIELMLFGLGFREEELHRKTDSFSAGWQMRIALAKTLLARPDVLLLDEPTNYLDIEARTWLTGYLESCPGCYLLVSHDRHFLDAAVNKIAELFLAGLTVYSGNYSAYEQQRKQELRELHEKYREQQEEIAKTEDFISKFRYNASKAKQVQSRIKYLEKLEPAAIPPNLQQLHLTFPPPERTGDIVLETDNLSKSYGEVPVFSDLRLTIERGEKIGVVGMNGAGKSSLLRMLAGRDNSGGGEIRRGSNVKTGYYAEELLQQFTGNTAVLELLEQEAPAHLQPKLRNFLGSFLFSGDDIYKPASVLSGGEKSRLAILRMILHPVNFLVLDEPTNHLDIHSKDILLDALKNYAGTVIFVSHDWYFLEQLAGKVLELEGGRGRYYYGGYSYYLWKKEREREKAEHDASPAPDPRERPEGKTGYEEEKRRKNEAKQREREEERLLGEIEKADGEIARLAASLDNPDIYSDHIKSAEIQQKIREAEQRQHLLMEKWEALS